MRYIGIDEYRRDPAASRVAHAVANRHGIPVCEIVWMRKSGNDWLICRYLRDANGRRYLNRNGTAAVKRVHRVSQA